ncbi:MAG TPA: hypothetical protein VK488_08720 [Gaiellaceae bacterium]|nr:hypothetical protein [Gaiellaceae bacterium]
MTPVLADFAEYAGFVFLPLVFIGGLAALLLSSTARLAPSDNQSTRLGLPGLAVVLGLATAWLVLYALSADGYYGSSDVSHWEHAGRSVGTFPVVLAVAAASATIIGLVASAVLPGRGRLRFMSALAAALSCLLLLFGWFVLAGGH